CLFVPPLGAAQHDFDHNARCWTVLARRPQEISWARSAPVNTSSALPRPTGAVSSRPASRSAANWRRHFDTELTATPGACAAAAFDPTFLKLVRYVGQAQRWAPRGRFARFRVGSRGARSGA